MGGVPSNIIVPFIGVDFDSSQANQGPVEVPINMYVIGQRLSTGTVEANIKFLATSADEVAEKSGYGSVLHRMAIKAFLNNDVVPITFIGLDDGAGTQATHAVDITGAVTKAGELVIYIAGERFAVTAALTATGAELGALLVAAINADTRLQVTAAYAVDTLTLTCKNDGIAAGDLDVRFNYNAGEETPAGITLGSVVTTAGTVDPDVTDAMTAIGDDWFNVIAQPYTDNTSMNTIEAALDTNASVLEMRDSVCYQAHRDTLAAMITFGEDSNRNSEWMATLPAYKRLESTYEIAAAVAAASAKSLVANPPGAAAVPLHRIQLKGMSILDPNDTWNVTERNQLAKAGISTLKDDLGVQTDATVTMYLKNSAGASDTAYQQQNTMYTLSALRYRFVNQIATKYPRAKLADAADNLRPGQQIMTVDIAETEAVTWFKQAQADGLVDPSNAALTQFKEQLVVQRDSTNNNRINWLTPPDLMNQFIVGSNTIQFRS